MTEGESRLSPLCLIIPGLYDSGPGHWQTIWERERHDCVRVRLGMWSDPVRNVWVSRIDQAVGAAQGPVVLVGHGLGCMAVLWWASLLNEDAPGNVVGALLVAPPDADRPADPRLARFAPAPHAILPFPALVVASSDDIWCEPARAEELSTAWGADFVLLDQAGHINAKSGVVPWRQGQDLLERLLDSRPRIPSAFAWPARTRPERVAMTGV
jgi:hypothetical protein